MSNQEIASHFYELARLMDLHEENAYKIRSYQNAGGTLKRWDQPLAELSEKEILDIPGVGKAIGGKIQELLNDGKMSTLERYREMTPAGVRDMLTISGYGPGKIRILWQELGVESMGELMYAINENRVMRLKGFGKKTQEDLQAKLRYRQTQMSNFLYASVEASVEKLLKIIAGDGKRRVACTGAYRRQDPVLEKIEIIVSGEELTPGQWREFGAVPDNGYWRFQGWPLDVQYADESVFGSALLESTGPDSFLQTLSEMPAKAHEEEVFRAVDLPIIHPARRSAISHVDQFNDESKREIITIEDVKGVVHCHSDYSDGIQPLKSMASHARSLGYSYLGITDHSKSAVYADGMTIEEVRQQWAEADALNAKMDDFTIYKGIESDILADGSLDYPDDILSGFDFVISSIHTHISKEIDKATARIIKAIENPHTTILGHPTGRLLLTRPAYPVHIDKIVDACISNRVVIELNANPYRLDLDWRHVERAIEKGAMISINPDAHNLTGMDDIRYGVLVAQKAGVTAGDCLTCMSREDFAHHIRNK